MEQSGEYRVSAPRTEVWDALNDPAVLMRCIEGCQSMEDVGDGRFEAKVQAKVGPVKATFDAEIELADVVKPESYRLVVGVKGGVAGFAQGTASVRLEEVDGGTQLNYEIEGGIGGKLAQIGSRLVSVAAKRTADKFFTRFIELMEATDARQGA